jgi:hypothetical protein
VGIEPRSSRRFERLNAIALALALLVFAALGLAWWRDRARQYDTPRFDPARFVELSPAEPLAGRERWLVAVNLDCPHCQAHLRALAVRTAARAHPPALAVLVVDQPSRPAELNLGVALAGGAWWDRAQVWRERWGRRVYGETFRFDSLGRLLSSTPAGVVPDSSGSRM